MYMLLIGSCACWVCIDHQTDVIILAFCHPMCDVLIGILL